MPKEYSPFTPGQPVPVEFFVGREPEVTRLKAKAGAAAATGRLQVVFVSGERGIGKSSLASFVGSIAERDHRALALHAHLGGSDTIQEMVRTVFDRLLKESIGKSWGHKIKDFFGKHIREVGLFGVTVEFGAPEKDLQRLANDFAPALRNLMQKIQGEKEAMLLFLDDINGLAESAQFANWLKSLVDEIATGREPLPLCLVLVGLEDRRQSLIELQPSLARVFDLIEIPVWGEKETAEFFRNAFSKIAVPVEQKAMDILSHYAGGLPVLAHEIGEAVFNADEDGRIDAADAMSGTIMAADIVGRKHLRPQVFQAIRSARYRTILRKIATNPFEIRFKRADMHARLNAEERRVLDNFLTRMKRLEVILPDPDGGPGAYRFRNHLHYVYFWLEAQSAKATRQP